MRRMAAIAGVVNLGAAIVGITAHSAVTVWVCGALAAVAFALFIILTDTDLG